MKLLPIHYITVANDLSHTFLLNLLCRANTLNAVYLLLFLGDLFPLETLVLQDYCLFNQLRNNY